MLTRLIRETDALAALTGDALLLVDNDGIIVHATSEAGVLFATPPNQLTGTVCGIPLAGAGDAEVRLEQSGRRVAPRFERLSDQGLPLTRVLLRDVTALRDAQEELAAARKAALAGERAKSHFLANITHEIRTPMIGILGMTELTLATELTDKQREYLEMARHSAASLLTVLNDIVDYARIEVGALDLAKTPFDLRATLEEAVSVFRPLAVKKGLALECRLVGDVPEALVGDASRLRQILINLVGNAVKFTDSGSVILAVSPAGGESQPDTVRLRFAVRDTGIGIPRDKIRAIFDSFTQADVSPARRYQGAGLGLAIVRHLVAMQGGTYGVESEEGQGSVFSFSLVFALPAARAEAQGLAAADGEVAKARPLTVLLAEDNPINQIYARELLETDGHEVVTAHTGRRALEMLRRRHFDVILMDIQMPEMDGLEATRAIRTDESGDFDPAIPIVALTAHALKGDREAFLRAGMNEYLSKPVSPEALAAALARAMGEAASAETDASPSGSAPAPCDETPEVLVWAELLTKARGNTGFLMKLFAAFVAEQPGNLEIIREALARSDHGQLAFLAHTLKGAAATMCAPFLRQACLDLERAAKENDAALEVMAFEAMETAMREVMQAMRERLENDATAGTPCAR
ncbi:response regulator [Solidesulfovibrio alcoholivorans]|uniref:response regulator n=1 Tax=Solidesulfovibrio alcoholivorans TaxID=81406 RepID=UPI0005C25141|nr:response regulator [Solidesulfovibrio alcoholivorans]